MDINAIAHIVGLDEINKRILHKKLSAHVQVIDLDKIQYLVYNHRAIKSLKNIWSRYAKDLILLKDQKKYAGKSSKTQASNQRGKSFDKKIQLTHANKKKINEKIHQTWKEKMNKYIQKLIESHDEDKKKNNKQSGGSKNRIFETTTDDQVKESRDIVFFGFNIFPKDYRVKVQLPIKRIGGANKSDQLYNFIQADIPSEEFTSNTIKYNLKKYEEKITHGKFPLSMLDVNYLSKKQEKFNLSYEKLGYKYQNLNEIPKIIFQLTRNLQTKHTKIDTKPLYLVLPYKLSSGTIPVDTFRSIKGFTSPKDAMTNYQLNTKNNSTIIYLYTVSPHSFHLINGELNAVSNIEIIRMDEKIL
jgi:hypothetical protein